MFKEGLILFSIKYKTGQELILTILSIELF